MGLLSVVFVAFALAVDAFAVAMVTGVSVAALTARRVFRLAFHFGLFQALMPILGWCAGTAIHRHIAAIDHWMAFALLAVVGGRSQDYGSAHDVRGPSGRGAEERRRSNASSRAELSTTATDPTLWARAPRMGVSTPPDDSTNIVALKIRPNRMRV